MSMRSRSVLRALFAVSLALALTAPLGCESDGGGNGGGSDTVTPTDTGGGGGGDTAGGQRTLFKAQVKDFQTKITHANAECWLLFNAYPEDYAQWSDDPDLKFTRVPQNVMDQVTGGGYTNPLTSASGGNLEIMLPAGTRWGWECDKGDSYRKTYQFNISSDSTAYEDEEIWIIPNGLYALAPQLANIELDSRLGVVAGRLVWDNPATGEEEYVGCATLSTVPGTDDVRYFGTNDLPVPTSAEGGRDTSHPRNGLFIAANMPLGAVTMTARIGGTIIGREVIFSESESVVISNIHAGEGPPNDDDITPADANPTPGTCN
jgi:hypothetical protein